MIVLMNQNVIIKQYFWLNPIHMIVSTTYQGKTIDESYKPSSTDFLSDSDDEDLDKLDTQLHFGGGKFDSQNAKESGAYGPSGGGAGDLGTAYRSKREELEDRIKRKKMEKAEKMKRKEDMGE